MGRRIYQSPQFVAIIESAGDVAGDLVKLNAPLANLGDIYWHSGLDYWVIAYDQTLSLTLPARNYPPGNAKHYFPNHNLGFEPFGVLLIGNAQLPTGEPVQGSTSAARHAVLGVNSTQLWLFEAWNYSSLPALTLSFRAILLKPAPTNTSPHLLEESPPRVIYGGGKFDTDNNYLKSSPAAPDFWMTRGRTIDTINGGYKGLRPNGDAQFFNTYAGNFQGEGFFGVAD